MRVLFNLRFLAIRNAFASPVASTTPSTSSASSASTGFLILLTGSGKPFVQGHVNFTRYRIAIVARHHRICAAYAVTKAQDGTRRDRQATLVRVAGTNASTQRKVLAN